MQVKAASNLTDLQQISPSFTSPEHTAFMKTHAGLSRDVPKIQEATPAVAELPAGSPKPDRPQGRIQLKYVPRGVTPI